MFAIGAVVISALGVFGVGDNWFMLFLTLGFLALHLLVGLWPFRYLFREQ